MQNDGGSRPKKHKAACDQCNASKVKCPGGGPPCNRCANSSQPCHYSLARRAGKPRGTRNRKTLERLRQAGGDSPEQQNVGAKEMFTQTEIDRREAANQAPNIPSQHQHDNVSHNQPESSYLPDLWPLSPLGDYPTLQNASHVAPISDQDFLDCITNTGYSVGERLVSHSSDPEIPVLERLGTSDLSKTWATPPDDCWDVSFYPMTYQ